MIAGLLGKLLASKLGVAGASAIAGALVVKAVPLAKPLLGKLIRAQVDRALAPNTADPKEDELRKNLVLAAIALAEYKIPDRGAGQAKKALAASALSRFLPGLSGEIVGDLVQEAFDSLDDDLKKRLGVNQ